MALTTLDKNPAAEMALWAEFSYGTTTQRYTTWTSAIVIGGETFNPARGLSAEIGKNHGGVEDQPSYLKIGKEYEPVAALVRGYVHAPVSVTFGRVDPSNPAETATTLYRGDIGKLVLNPAGQQGIVRCEILGVKSKLNIRLGLFMSPACQWIFGSDFCGATPITVTGTVSAVRTTGNTVVEVQSSFADLTAELWRRGSVSVDGASAMIRSIEAITGGARMVLTRVPPDDWVGASIEVRSGCDKQSSTCSGVYDNIPNFQGPGISIPPYNPIVSIS